MMMQNHKLFRIALLLVCGLWAAPQLRAQDLVAELGSGFIFNHTDVMLDASFGACYKPWDISARLAFQPRLGSKRVLVESGTPNLLYQYRERRYMLGLSADKRFTLTEFNDDARLALFVGGFIGMTFNDYRGTDAKGSVDLGIEGTAGACMVFDDAFILRLGYVYLPLPTTNVFPHRLAVTFSILL